MSSILNRNGKIKQNLQMQYPSNYVRNGHNVFGHSNIRRSLVSAESEDNQGRRAT